MLKNEQSGGFNEKQIETNEMKICTLSSAMYHFN